jgi:hypothetical protein
MQKHLVNLQMSYRQQTTNITEILSSGQLTSIVERHSFLHQAKSLQAKQKRLLRAFELSRQLSQKAKQLNAVLKNKSQRNSNSQLVHRQQFPTSDDLSTTMPDNALTSYINSDSVNKFNPISHVDCSLPAAKSSIITHDDNSNSVCDYMCSEDIVVPLKKQKTVMPNEDSIVSKQLVRKEVDGFNGRDLALRKGKVYREKLEHIEAENSSLKSPSRLPAADVSSVTTLVDGCTLSSVNVNSSSVEVNRVRFDTDNETVSSSCLPVSYSAQTIETDNVSTMLKLDAYSSSPVSFCDLSVIHPVTSTAVVCSKAASSSSVQSPPTISKALLSTPNFCTTTCHNTLPCSQSSKVPIWTRLGLPPPPPSPSTISSCSSRMEESRLALPSENLTGIMDIANVPVRRTMIPWSKTAGQEITSDPPYLSTQSIPQTSDCSVQPATNAAVSNWLAAMPDGQASVPVFGTQQSWTGSGKKRPKKMVPRCYPSVVVVKQPTSSSLAGLTSSHVTDSYSMPNKAVKPVGESHHSSSTQAFCPPSLRVTPGASAAGKVVNTTNVRRGLQQLLADGLINPGVNVLSVISSVSIFQSLHYAFNFLII